MQHRCEKRGRATAALAEKVGHLMGCQLREFFAHKAAAPDTIAAVVTTTRPYAFVPRRYR